MLPQTSAQPAPPVLAQAGAPTAAQMLKAAKAVREAVGTQARQLQDKRSDLSRQLRDARVEDVDRAGLEARLKTIDLRIIEVDQQIAVADANIQKAASVPGAIVEEPPYHRPGPPPEAYGVAAFGIFVIGFPIAFAYARRIWRRSGKVTVTLPPDVATRMQAMEEAIESIAVEVERVGEGQRFMTQALSEKGRQIGAGVAQPIPVRPRETARMHTPV